MNPEACARARFNAELVDYLGFNFTDWPAHVPEAGHRHPLADECLFLWRGKAEFNLGAGWIEAEANDCALAPCGVLHATRNSAEAV